MALLNSGSMGKHCWKFIKQAFRLQQTGTWCALKPAILESRVALSLFLRQHYALCSNTDTSCMLGTSSYSVDSGDKPFSLLQRKTSVASRSVRWKTSLTGSVVADIIKDLDIEELKSQVKQERMNSDQNIHMADRLKEIIAERCDKAVANLSEEDQRKLKVIQLEHSFLYSEGYHIPSPEEMCNEYWLEALNAPSKSQRLKYYMFVSKRRHQKEAQKMKKDAAKEKSKDGLKMDTYEHGRIFMRIYESTMLRWQNYRLATAMQFGIPLVLDMDYASYMHPREIKNTAEQVLDVYCQNRADSEFPFHLHLTSCAQDNPTYNLMQLRLQDADFLATVTDKNYLDLFDKDRLVYLSPDSRQVMREFDPTAVYIIGAFNDKAVHVPASYARAKEQEIKCLRLPLDEYVHWNQGGKDLTLDQMLKIMRDLKNNKSWLEAFRAIPSRKVRKWEK